MKTIFALLSATTFVLADHADHKAVLHAAPSVCQIRTVTTTVTVQPIKEAWNAAASDEQSPKELGYHGTQPVESLHGGYYGGYASKLWSHLWLPATDVTSHGYAAPSASGKYGYGGYEKDDDYDGPGYGPGYGHGGYGEHEDDEDHGGYGAPTSGISPGVTSSVRSSNGIVSDGPKISSSSGNAGRISSHASPTLSHFFPSGGFQNTSRSASVDAHPSSSKLETSSLSISNTSSSSSHSLSVVSSSTGFGSFVLSSSSASHPSASDSQVVTSSSTISLPALTSSGFTQSTSVSSSILTSTSSIILPSSSGSSASNPSSASPSFHPLSSDSSALSSSTSSSLFTSSAISASSIQSSSSMSSFSSSSSSSSSLAITSSTITSSASSSASPSSATSSSSSAPPPLPPSPPPPTCPLIPNIACQSFGQYRPGYANYLEGSSDVLVACGYGYAQQGALMVDTRAASAPICQSLCDAQSPCTHSTFYADFEDCHLWETYSGTHLLTTTPGVADGDACFALCEANPRCSVAHFHPAGGLCREFREVVPASPGRLGTDIPLLVWKDGTDGLEINCDVA